MSDPVEVLDFWLGEVGPEGWYAGGDDLDGEIRGRFADLWCAARDGGLDHWIDGTVGTLAFLVLTDQFPRNMWRGTADAFATDAQARGAARRALEAGWDMHAPEPERQFFYMPFVHSENEADQALGVELQSARLTTEPEMAFHARVHHSIITRFGRFPYRNEALGRETTAEEEAFLADGGYAAAVRAMES